VKEVTPIELKQMQDSKEDFVLIDVREEHESDICSIGGKLIPMGSVLENLAEIPKDKKVVVYCRSGNRSGMVIQTLEQRSGYTNLYNLKGGILAYSDQVDPGLMKY
jgi:adenylyltransferase/sulfurtransferase